MQIFLRLYNYFEHRRTRLFWLLAAVVAVLGCLAARIEYKEDIADFMPFDAEYRKAMQVYQEVAAGSRVVLLFGVEEGVAERTMAEQTLSEAVLDELPTDDANLTEQVVADADLAEQTAAEANLTAQTAAETAPTDYIIAGVERFGEVLAELDTAQWVNDWQPQIDYGRVLDVIGFVYEHLPLFLTSADYARLDSLLAADPAYVTHQLQTGLEQLSGPAGTMLQPMLQHDPLGLGQRLGGLLRQYQPELQFAHEDGYVFTPDRRRCIVSLTSPFGSSETDGNARLMRLLDETARRVQSDPACRQLTVSPIGSPAIAVANASQIKHDSLLAIALAAVFILALLLYAFRSLRPLLHIALATGFGFLFALGCLGIWCHTLSVIVLGIASIIIGIAVNYPLHYLCHRQHEPDPRRALAELVKPLVVGNVTTVGAFLTLVPLNAVAVRDLGLFSALMLVGTILFVLIVMPHLPVSARAIDLDAPRSSGLQTFDRLAERVIRSRFALVLLVVLTAVLGWFSLRTEFDSNLSHLNYMTSRQRTDMAYLQSLQGQTQQGTVFVTVSSPTADASLTALEQLMQQAREAGMGQLVASGRNPADLLPSVQTQRARLAQWQAFWTRHGYTDGLSEDFRKAAAETGFTDSAFAPFEQLLTAEPTVLSIDDFAPLTTTLLTGLVRDGQLVAQLQVPVDDVPRVEDALRNLLPDSPTATADATTAEYHIFDLASLNSRVSDALSDNFNYIGLACSVIVFMFLWFSFGSLRLAIIAFLPMAIGWLWILGLMQLLGIQFNIVNVILATFIFGQGDDYTIFITEGLVRSEREGGRTLVSYQRSILLSALIMLIGIGSLIVARHPAMHSLAEVTIIGMAVVVLMAWFVPPMVFRLFQKK